jgi:hypothetical protein
MQLNTVQQWGHILKHTVYQSHNELLDTGQNIFLNQSAEQLHENSTDFQCYVPTLHMTLTFPETKHNLHFLLAMIFTTRKN